MAEIPTEAVNFLLEKLIAVVADEVGLILGFNKELKRLEQRLRLVHAFLVDASSRETGKDQAVKLWLRKLEDTTYEVDDLLDEFNYEINRRKADIQTQMKRKVCCFFTFSAPNDVAFRSKMAHKIKDVNMKLRSINDEASSYGLQSRVAQLPAYVPLVMETNSITVDPIFIGRDDVESSIIEDMTTKSGDELVVSVVPIVGMGGLGKTTLARKVFNHPSVENHFKERIWVSLSKPVDNKLDLFVKILKSLSKDSVDASLGEEAVLGQLKSKLKDARYLIVLDDYLNDTNTKQNWENFMNCLLGINSNMGNFIIVTTRDQDVVSIVKTKTEAVDSLWGLSDDECWSIIKARAFPRQEAVPQQFEAIGKEIARTCQGLPLAANVIGGTLQGKGMDDWISFRDKSGSLKSNPEDNYVLEVLKISFDRLPSPLYKKCFAYCSIFEKGEEIESERLIQLWMAEGFLFGDDDQKMDMESLGANVYNILLQNFFLHEPVKNEYGRIMYCKMHDLVHDLSCSIVEADPPVRYLAVVDEKQNIRKEQAIYLRTLFARRGGVELINDAFQDCRSLRVLYLSFTFENEDWISSIDKLIHLRFLDLLHTDIRRVPAAVCKLFNLQTLKIGGVSLEELPDQLKCLVGLRHLILVGCYDINRMPFEIGKLTSLRTLNLFIVSDEEGRRIDELGYLKNLRGELEIQSLEKVSNKEESLRACLSEKENIEKLEFVWSWNSSSESNHDNEVLEGLQPHTNLKDLHIKRFNGNQYPSWTMTLNKLINIHLERCKKCEEIPALGHLPLLKFLMVEGLENVRSIGDSFYTPRSRYMSNDEWSRHSVLFPALEGFTLMSMVNLRDWVEAPNTGATAFPRLKHLSIQNCRDMTTGPSHDFPSLEILDITSSKIPLDRICSKSNSLTNITILGNPNFTSLSADSPSLQKVVLWDCQNLREFQLSGVNSLRNLTVRNCSNLASIQNLETCSTSLQDLEIWDCPNLTQLQLSGTPGSKSLRSLTVHNCSNLASIENLEACSTSLEILEVWECPNVKQLQLSGTPGFQSLRRLIVRNCYNLDPIENLDSGTSLEVLAITGCPKTRTLPRGMECLSNLRELEIGPYSDETDPFTWSNGSQLRGLHQLQTLRFRRNPNWEYVPVEVQHLTALTSLILEDFGIEALPEWFNSTNYSNLRQLGLGGCEKLRLVGCLQHLTDLELLGIYGCSLLGETIFDSESSSRVHISHIPFVDVNGRIVQN